MAAAIIPKYALKWIHSRNWEEVYSGEVRVDWRHVHFSIQKEQGDSLGFPLFVADVPGLFDRPGIYNDPSGAPYSDEAERYLVFQQAVLHWLRSFPREHRPKVLHCHDHHTGLIPFMVKHTPDFRSLHDLPTVFSIHNGQYQGWMSWSNMPLLPYFDAAAKGLLEWNGYINPMASALRCAWAVGTVSRSYLFELHENSLGLEPLFREEWAKQFGIVNGIDAAVWNPASDPMIVERLHFGDIDAFKSANKRALCEWFGFSPELPLISFIGRLVYEKGADILPDAIRRFIHAGGRANFLVLGTGEAWTQNEFRRMAHQYMGRFNAVIDYNEALSHQIYAGSDFMVMPSRVEPCGLNQMYAMRYGTLPIVRSVGGLKDTVPDIGEPGDVGRGIRFDQFSLDDVTHAFYRAASMWHNEPGIVRLLRGRVMSVDFSWENTIDQYLYIYRRTGANVQVASPDAAPPSAHPETPHAQTPNPLPTPKPAPRARKKPAPKKKQ